MELKAGYLILTIALNLLLMFIGFYAINHSTDGKDTIRKKLMLVSGLVLWQVYVLSMSAAGVLDDLSFPPRFALFLIFPAFIFTGVFISRNSKKAWIQAIPPHWLIFTHLYRIGIEVLFIFSVEAGILHHIPTFEGYNFDLVYAATAAIVGWLMLKDPDRYRKLALGWNFLGLAVIASIIFLFQAVLYFPHIFGDVEAFPPEFVQIPYLEVASFLMPAAVFLHILSIAQLRNRISKTETSIPENDA